MVLIGLHLSLKWTRWNLCRHIHVVFGLKPGLLNCSVSLSLLPVRLSEIQANRLTEVSDWMMNFTWWRQSGIRKERRLPISMYLKESSVPRQPGHAAFLSAGWGLRLKVWLLLVYRWHKKHEKPVKINGLRCFELG